MGFWAIQTDPLPKILREIHKFAHFFWDYEDQGAHDSDSISPHSDPLDFGSESKQKRLGRGRGIGKTMTGLKFMNGDYWCQLTVGAHRLIVKLWTNKPEAALRRRRFILDLVQDEEWLAQNLGVISPSGHKAINQKKSKRPDNVISWRGKPAGAMGVEGWLDGNLKNVHSWAEQYRVLFEKEA